MPVPVAVRLLAPLPVGAAGADEMRAMAADVRYQMPVLVMLTCRIVSPRSSTRGTGRRAERTIAGG